MTVFPRQGHYTRDPKELKNPAADVTIERIGEFLQWDLERLRSAAAG